MNNNESQIKSRGHRSFVANHNNYLMLRFERIWKRLQWYAIILMLFIFLFLCSVVIRYYCLTTPSDDDCTRLSIALWPFAYCSKTGITL